MKFTNFLFITVISICLTSCELHNNINPKEVTNVTAGALFANAQVDLFNLVDDADIKTNISRFLAQYWAESTYASASNYAFGELRVPDNFQIQLYGEVLRDLKEATRIALAKNNLPDQLAIERNNQVAIIGLLEVYAWHLLVDAFGDVPYSEALDAKKIANPVYDDAASIYIDIIRILTSAIHNIDETAGSFGSADLVYDGDILMWKKFGASLLLRLGMRLTDVNEPVSRKAVSDALSFGVFEAREEAALHYTGDVPHVNTIYNQFVLRNWHWFLPSNTIVDIMNNLNDPRRELWFTTWDGMFIGGFYGATNGTLGMSRFTDQFHEATLPAKFIDFMEVSFLLAEAIERGYNVPGTAEEYYNNGIKESILQWGGTMDDVNTYIASPKVAYSTAQGGWKQKIGTQKWIALYNRGIEGWAEWRRLDFPILNVSNYGATTYDLLPLRMPYPWDEYKHNEDNVKAAIEKLGGDYHWLPVFWDVQ